MLYFVIHVLSSYHIVHGIPSFSFHYLITHAAPHFIYTWNLTCFEFPALPGWACALQFFKTAIRFPPMLVYLLIFYCRCTLPDPKLESRPCWVNEGDTCVFVVQKILAIHEINYPPSHHDVTVQTIKWFNLLNYVCNNIHKDIRASSLWCTKKNLILKLNSRRGKDFYSITRYSSYTKTHSCISHYSFIFWNVCN